MSDDLDWLVWLSRVCTIILEQRSYPLTKAPGYLLLPIRNGVHKSSIIGPWGMVHFVEKRRERDICEKYENCMLSENVHDRSFRLDKKFLLQLETNPRFQNIGGRLTVHMIA